MNNRNQLVSQFARVLVACGLVAGLLPGLDPATCAAVPGNASAAAPRPNVS